jgi:hypothetical protein
LPNIAVRNTCVGRVFRPANTRRRKDRRRV